MSGNFDYYRVDFKLLRPMLGTATETSIYSEHILQKAKKEIAKANKLRGKVSKALEKYKGDEISEKKEVMELQAVLRAYQQLTGNTADMPASIEGILALAEEVEEEFNEMVKSGEQRKATVFLKGEDGWPIISTHMILGNLKEILRTIVNNGDKEVIKSKVAVGELMTLDVKAVEPFMRPSNDIVRDEKGERVIIERPIRFSRMGKEETAIALSEQLPEGTTFGSTLRVRKGSPVDESFLKKLFDLGKNCGLGAHRGSGNMGGYVFKLQSLPDYKEVFEDGWM